MNKHRIAVIFILGLFVGVVGANTVNGASPNSSKILSYFHQAHTQQQAH